MVAVVISLHGFAYATPFSWAFASESANDEEESELYALNDIASTETPKGVIGSSSATIHKGTYPAYATAPSESLSSDDVKERLKDEGIPFVSIGEVEVPLHGGYLDRYVWALVDMMFALGGIALVVYMMIRKGKSEKFGLGGYSIKDTGEDEERASRFRCMCGKRAIILCVVGVVMFLIVWEVNNQMVLVNNWTILNGIVFAAEAVVVKLSFKKKRTGYSSAASRLSRSV